MKKLVVLIPLILFILSYVPASQAQVLVEWPVCNGPAGWLSADINSGFMVTGAEGGIGLLTSGLVTLVSVASNCLANVDFDYTNPLSLLSLRNIKTCATSDLPAVGTLDQLLMFIPVGWFAKGGTAAIEWFGLTAINDKLYIVVGPKVSAYLVSIIQKLIANKYIPQEVVDLFIRSGLLSESWTLEKYLFLPTDFTKWINFYWHISDGFSHTGSDTCSISTWFPSTIKTPVKAADTTQANKATFGFWVYNSWSDYRMSMNVYSFATGLCVTYSDGTKECSPLLYYADISGSVNNWVNVSREVNAPPGKNIVSASAWLDSPGPGVYLDDLDIGFTYTSSGYTVTPPPVPSPTNTPSEFDTPTPIVQATTTGGTAVAEATLPPIQPTRLPRIKYHPTRVPTAECPATPVVSIDQPSGEVAPATPSIPAFTWGAIPTPAIRPPSFTYTTYSPSDDIPPGYLVRCDHLDPWYQYQGVPITYYQARYLGRPGTYKYFDDIYAYGFVTHKLALCGALDMEGQLVNHVNYDAQSIENELAYQSGEARVQITNATMIASYGLNVVEALPAVTLDAAAPILENAMYNAGISIWNDAAVPFLNNLILNADASLDTALSGGQCQAGNGVRSVSGHYGPNNRYTFSGVVSDTVSAAGITGGRVIALTVDDGGVVVYQFSNGATTINALDAATVNEIVALAISVADNCESNANVSIPDVSNFVKTNVNKGIATVGTFFSNASACRTNWLSVDCGKEIVFFAGLAALAALFYGILSKIWVWLNLMVFIIWQNIDTISQLPMMFYQNFQEASYASMDKTPFLTCTDGPMGFNCRILAGFWAVNTMFSQVPFVWLIVIVLLLYLIMIVIYRRFKAIININFR